MKAPSSSQFQNQLMTTYSQSQASLNNSINTFQTNLAAANAAAANSVSQTTSGINSSVNAATQTPVSLGTLMTSPRGVLGNPALSYTKLGG